MRRLTTRLAAVLSATLVASTLALTVAAPAQAAPPVVVDDEMTVYANTVHLPDLLANDTDPDGDELAICRIKEVMNDRVIFTNLLGMPILGFAPGVSGTFTFTYYACDFETLVPGTLTVHVKKNPKVDVKVTKLKKPGKVRVTNRSGFPLDFAWGHAEKARPDGTVRVGKKSSRVITVRRTAITWVAGNEQYGAEKYGFLGGIKLPKGKKSLPASPRPRAGVAAFTDSLDQDSWATALKALRQG